MIARYRADKQDIAELGAYMQGFIDAGGSRRDAIRKLCVDLGWSGLDVIKFYRQARK